MNTKQLQEELDHLNKEQVQVWNLAICIFVFITNCIPFVIKNNSALTLSNIAKENLQIYKIHVFK